jgi:serine acetyltransferase
MVVGNRSGFAVAAKICDRVYIGAVAKILALLSIRNDTVVEANAVVNKDVPAAKS